MKLKTVFATGLSLLIFPLAAIEAVLSASPSRPVAGEVFALELTVNSSENFSWKVPSIPGLRVSRNFNSTSTRHTVINGKAEISAVYGLSAVAEKPGKLIIPPLTLDFNGKKVVTNSLQLLIRDPASLPDAEKFSAVLHITPDRKVYVGETLRAGLELFVPQPWQLQRLNSITVENFAGGIFFNGKGSGNFSQTSPLYRRNGGTAGEFAAVFQVQESGEFTPECRITMQVSKGGGDFFFGPPPEIRQIVAVSPRKLQVLPLPPVPEGVVDTGLVGKWQVSGKISKSEFKAGDIAEVILTFRGEDPTMGFRAPELDIPGARVYPAEVKKNSSGTLITVKYPFVAVKAGDYKLQLDPAVFDPETGKYISRKLSFAYRVKVNPALSASSPAPQYPSAHPAETEVEAVKYTPLPLVKPGKAVKLPLWRNNLAAVIIFFAAGLLAAAASLLNIPRNKDKKQLKRQLRQLMKNIRSSGDPGKLLLDGKLPLIAEAIGLPPGSTLQNIAEKVDDPEVKNYLCDLDKSAFMPGAKSGSITPEIRKKLLSFLSKMAVLTIFAGVFALDAADFSAIQNDFDNARYPAAVDSLNKMLAVSKDQVDPALICDLGCIDYMQGNYPEAYCRFTQAKLLAPQNSFYRRAAAMAAEKLPVKVTAGAAEYFGFMRPDQYLLSASILLAAAGVLLLMRRRIGGTGTAAAVLAALAVSCIVICVWQDRTTYASNRAIVTGRNAFLHSIPAAEGGRQTPLAAGIMVLIREEKGGFCRVENADISGWVSCEYLTRTFPPDIRSTGK
ncbi:MAG: BatD family protein [Lentisphaeria bacterium]|nr:BatD family protein [Lentisphaeria bacterium]